MGKQENLAALGKFAEAVNTGKFDLFREAVAAGCVDHDPAPGQGPGPEGYRTFFRQRGKLSRIWMLGWKRWWPMRSRWPSLTR